MSMEVDLSTPLTDEERRYLAERGQHDVINRVDEQHGTVNEEQFYGDGSGPQMRPVLAGEAAAARKQQLLDELAALEAAEGDEAADDEADDEAETDEEEPVPYEQLTAAQLDAELKARELPTSGSKADKIKRLEADDAE